MRYFFIGIFILVITLSGYFAYENYFNKSKSKVEEKLLTFYEPRKRFFFTSPAGYLHAFNTGSGKDQDILTISKEVLLENYNSITVSTSISFKAQDQKPLKEISKTFYYTKFDNKYLVIEGSTSFYSFETESVENDIAEQDKKQIELSFERDFETIVQSLKFLSPNNLSKEYCEANYSCSYLNLFNLTPNERNNLEFLHYNNRVLHNLGTNNSKKYFYSKVSIFKENLVILKQLEESKNSKITLLSAEDFKETGLEHPNLFITDILPTNDKIYFVTESDLYVYDDKTKKSSLIRKGLFSNDLVKIFRILSQKDNKIYMLASDFVPATFSIIQYDLTSNSIKNLYNLDTTEAEQEKLKQLLKDINLNLYREITYFSGYKFDGPIDVSGFAFQERSRVLETISNSYR